MFTAHDIIFGVALPAVIGLVVMLIGRLVTAAVARRRPATAATILSLTSAISIAAGFAAAFRSIHEGWPAFPPAESSEWLFYIAVLLGVAGVAEAVFPRSRAARAALAFVVVAVAASVLLKFQMRQWPAVKYAGVVAGLALVGALWWTSLESAASGGRAWLTALMILLGAADAATLLLSDSLTFGKFGGAATAATAGTALLLFWPARTAVSARGIGLVFCGLMLSLLVASFYLANLALLPAIMLAVAPLGALFWPLLPGRSRWVSTISRLLTILLPLGAALALAARQSNREMQETGDPYSNFYSQ